MKSKNKFRPMLITVVGLAQITASHGALVAYEGFDYEAGGLNGANGGTGWSSAWSANASATVVATDLTYGGLETSGGSIATTGGVNHFGGSRTIDLTTPGLLANGSELWFSMMMGYNANGNLTNSRLVFVLGDTSMVTGNGNTNYFLNTADATGLGVTIGRFGDINGNIVANQVQDTNAGNVFGTGGDGSNPVLTAPAAEVDYVFVVGRITWGATEDTIDIFLPGADLALGSVHSTLTVDVDQSGYDTISWRRGDSIVLDEIRFGSSYAAVSPIPEPSAALLGGLGALLLLRRRR